MKQKSLLKNKRIIIPILIIDLIICLIVAISLKSLLLLFIVMVIHAILMSIFLNIVFHISVINIDRLKLFLNNKCIVNNLSEQEIYLKDSKIKTFDNSGSITHPSTLYFKDGFNGYKYWMVYTPYDNNDISLENPCIAVSNDGIHYESFPNLKNPLLPIIPKIKPSTYYNDPFLWYENNRLEIWYRFTIEETSLNDTIYRITSSDGLHWTTPEVMISNDGSNYLSFSIVKHQGIYYIYYFNTKFEFKYRISKDLRNWSQEFKASVEKFNGRFWHGEVKRIGEKLILLYMDREYNLFFAESSFNEPSFFKNHKKLKFRYYSKALIYGNCHLYKSSFLLIDEFLYLYVPFRVDELRLFNIHKIIHGKWELTVSKVLLKNVNHVYFE